MSFPTVFTEPPMPHTGKKDCDCVKCQIKRNKKKGIEVKKQKETLLMKLRSLMTLFIMGYCEGVGGGEMSDWLALFIGVVIFVIVGMALVPAQQAAINRTMAWCSLHPTENYKAVGLMFGNEFDCGNCSKALAQGGLDACS